MDREQILHQLLDIDNYETQLLVEKIVVDRKFDIPEWFYKFISESALVRIIRSHHETIGLVSNKFDIFLTNYIKYNKSFNKKALILYLLDNELYQYGYFLNPKLLLKYYKNHDVKNSSIVSELIHNWILVKETKVPNAYLKMYSISTSAPVPSLLHVFDYVRSGMHVSCADFIIPTLYEYWYDDTLHYFNSLDSDIKYKTLAEGYWGTSLSGVKIPTYKIPTSLIITYLEHMLNNNFKSRTFKLDIPTLIKAINYRTKTDNISSKEKDIIKDYILTLVYKNFENVDAIFWDMSNDEKTDLVHQLFENINDIQDISLINFDKYFKLTDYKLSFTDIKKLLNCGVDPKKILTFKYSGATGGEYADLIIEECCDDYIHELLIGEYEVYGIQSPLTLASTPQHSLDIFKNRYMMNGQYTTKLRRVILNNNDIVNMIGEQYILELLNLGNQPLKIIFTTHPNLILPFKRLLYTEDISDMINPYTLEYIPWTYITRNDMSKLIKSYGYTPVVSPKIDGIYPYKDIYEDNVKMCLVQTDLLVELINYGYGFGYILDYHISSYTYLLLRAALLYLRKIV